MSTTMNINKSILVILVLTLSIYQVRAQEILTIDRAIQIALENNFDIQVAKKSNEINQNNIYVGNAGLLPRVSVNASHSESNNTNQLNFAPPDQDDIDASGVGSDASAASIDLAYTLFDGLGNVYQYRKLKSLGDGSEVQTKIAVENTLTQTVASYLEVARLSEAYSISVETTDISKDRYERAKTRYEYGNALKIDLLTAEVDLNSDSVSLSQAELNLRNGKRNLNLLLARDPGIDYEVDLDIEINENMILDEVMEKAKANNSSLLLSQTDLSTAELDMKIARSSQMPRLTLNGSYGYNRTSSDVGFILSQSNLGFNAGLGLSMDIFDGNRKRKTIQNSKIAFETYETRMDQTEMQVEKNVMNAYDVYQNSLYLLEVEQRNLATSQLNFDRNQEAYNLGQVTNTQLRDAQLNLAQARTRINNLSFTAKLALVELLRLSGDLVTDY